MQIFVRIPNGRTLSVEVASSDTVEDVTAKIVDRDLVPRNSLRLLFGGKVLEEGSTMCDNNIQNNATLQLLPRLPGGTMIKVKTLTGKEVEINIEPTDTVARIKERVEEKEGIPPLQQRLIFGGKQMADDKTAGEYKIEGGSVLHLVLALRGGRL